MSKWGSGHPGFERVARHISRTRGVSMARARAILAAGTRRASPAARKANPRLNRVKGGPRGRKKK